MSGWLAPLNSVEIIHDSLETSRLCTEKWWEDGTVIMTSDKGSMEKRLISFLIQHVNRCVRKEVPPNLTYCMTLDGHSSREGYEWLQSCKKNHCEIVQSPSNTTHFLQPCDQDVNRSFEKSMRLYRDLLQKQTTLDMRSVRANLMVAALAYSNITIDIIKLSFKKQGYGQ